MCLGEFRQGGAWQGGIRQSCLVVFAQGPARFDGVSYGEVRQLCLVMSVFGPVWRDGVSCAEVRRLWRVGDCPVELWLGTLRQLWRGFARRGEVLRDLLGSVQVCKGSLGTLGLGLVC